MTYGFIISSANASASEVATVWHYMNSIINTIIIIIIISNSLTTMALFNYVLFLTMFRWNCPVVITICHTSHRHVWLHTWIPAAMSTLQHFSWSWGSSLCTSVDSRLHPDARRPARKGTGIHKRQPILWKLVKQHKHSFVQDHNHNHNKKLSWCWKQARRV